MWEVIFEFVVLVEVVFLVFFFMIDCKCGCIMRSYVVDGEKCFIMDVEVWV